MRRRLYREEDAALARLLSDTINDDRSLLLARIRLLKRILGRNRPEWSPAPLPRRSATGKSIGPRKSRIRRDSGKSAFAGQGPHPFAIKYDSPALSPSRPYGFSEIKYWIVVTGPARQMR